MLTIMLYKISETPFWQLLKGHAMKIAINGFGRIGRTFLRSLLSDPKASSKLEVVAINVGPTSKEQGAHLFKYDSTFGTFDKKVTYSNGSMTVNGNTIELIQERDPGNLPWEKLGVDAVVEASGLFKSRDAASKHIYAGAKIVVISAPSTDADKTIIPGINSSEFDYKIHKVVSLGSCTTNAIVPIIQVLKENYSITSAQFTTIHSYTNDQNLLDGEHPDSRRARSAATNLIPTSTGADKVVVKIFPELAGKIRGSSIRAPIPNMSLLDFTFTAKEELSAIEVNKKLEEASKTTLNGILSFTNEPLVSSDFIGNSHSSILDSSLTTTTGKMAKIFAWYDNEYGYSCRIKDFLLHSSQDIN